VRAILIPTAEDIRRIRDAVRRRLTRGDRPVDLQLRELP
jgi:hypothetical protein